MAGGAAVDWKGSLTAMQGRVERYKRNLLQAVFVLAQEWARRIADDARQNAPWTDRTGDARRGLFGKAVRLATGALIIVGGSVPYQVFLERRWGGKYAAILPALQRAYAAVMQSLQQLVR